MSVADAQILTKAALVWMPIHNNAPQAAMAVVCMRMSHMQSPLMSDCAGFDSCVTC